MIPPVGVRDGGGDVRGIHSERGCVPPAPGHRLRRGRGGVQGGVASSPRPHEMSALVRHTLVAHAFLRHVASGPFFSSVAGKGGRRLLPCSVAGWSRSSVSALVGSRNHRSLYPVTLDALISRPTTDSHPGCRISPIRRHSCEPSDESCVQSQARRLHPSRSNRSRSLPSPSPSRSG